MNVLPFTKTYGGRRVLDFCGFDFPAGKICSIIGANGSGKSTFARIAAGILKSDSGVPAILHGADVGYMPQTSYAFRLTTRKNILLSGGDSEKASHLMDMLELNTVSEARAKNLSGGETAKMALARLMMRRRDAVILDEPTSSMDMKSTLLAENLITDYCRSENAAVILITHSLRQTRRISDFVLYFHNGALLEYGNAEKLLASPEKPETKRFLEFFG